MSRKLKEALVHTCDPRGTGTRVTTSVRLALPTWQVLDQPGLYCKTLSQKTQRKKEKLYSARKYYRILEMGIFMCPK